ncbi:MAG: NADPH-dependent FMN reductase [Armatimonas sp.]
MESHKRVCLIGTSLNPDSRSQRLAREAVRLLTEQDVENRLIDLRTEEGREGLREAVLYATHLVFAVPIYNFNVNAVAKEVLENLPGSAFEGKVVGLICSAGGQRGYMSALSFANSLMMDFRCWIVPRFVYATKADFDEDRLRDEIATRVQLFVEDLLSK